MSYSSSISSGPDDFLFPPRISPSSELHSPPLSAGGSEVEVEVMDEDSRDGEGSGSRSSCSEMEMEQSTGVCRKQNRGKPKDQIWKYFVEHTIISADGRSLKMQRCIKCNDKVSAQAPRMRKHYEKCSKSIQDSSRESDSNDTDSQSSAASSPQRTKQVKLTDFVLKTSRDKQNELDRMAAKFWYSANLSFNSANLKTWKDFCSSMRPGYEPPSEHLLQGKLLDDTYQELHAKMTNDLKGKSGTLIQDGWSDVHNNPNISHTVVCDGEAFLLNSIECKADKKTSEYCAEKFEEAMQILSQLDFKVISGTTDNAKSMVKMRQILKEKYPDVLFYGCSPHMLNLLCEDITDKALTTKINEVSKFFRDHHKPAALLKDRNGLKPQLPATTRWSSHLDCIKIFLKNRTKYIEISQMPGICSTNVIESVNSLHIFRKAEELLVQMEEITEELLKLQSDKSSVADAAHSWLKLLNSARLTEYKENVKRRMEVATEDFFFLAYLLHPKYQGSLLSQDQKESCFDLLLERSARHLTTAHAFLAKNIAVFPKSVMHEDVMATSEPVDWWLSLRDSDKIPNDLIDYILPMFRSPSSTASIERMFSTYGFVQTDVRNRLTQDKVMKLSFCFRALRHSDTAKPRVRNVLG